MSGEHIKQWLSQAWNHRLAEEYRAGRISNSTMVLASLYHFLNSPTLPNTTVWLAPKLDFPPFQLSDFLNWKLYHLKKKLSKTAVDMMITHEDEVLAMVKLNYAAGGYGDYREHLALLEMVHQLRGEADIRLKLHPNLGYEDKGHSFTISEDMLLVYAVINQEASMSLEWDTLKSCSGDPMFWYHFLFLQGKIGNEQIKFRVREGK